MLTLSHDLHDTNDRLSSWFSSLNPRCPTPLTPESMAMLLSELLRAGTHLRLHPLPAKGHNLDLDAEVALYRTSVERLRDLLPEIHRQLLFERAQIEAERSRLQFAAQWAKASRQTL